MPKPNKEWTVMIYLGADSGLSVEFLWALKEMQEVKEVGDDKLVAVVAQFDPGQGVPTQRYVINHQSSKVPEFANQPDGWLMLDGEKIEDVSQNSQLKELLVGFKPTQPDPDQDTRLSKYLKRFEAGLNQRNKNTGDPLALLDFICWGIKNHEAKHYMVVLAGHGSGAVGDFLLTDQTSKDSLTLHELKDVFELVQKKLDGKKNPPTIDILGMDSCLMSMVEVYYQLKGSVSYLVGAEGFEPTSGWPYQRILESFVALAKDPTNGPADFAKRIVDDYVLYYFDYALAGLSVNLAACDIEKEKTDALAHAVEELGKNLTVKLEDRRSRSVVMEARQKAQCYKFDQYVDLWDFCDQLESLEKTFKDCCTALKAAIDERVVLNSSYVGPDYQNSHGLSVYFPWNSVPKNFSDGYEKLVFAQTTHWGEFVKKFTEEIRALQLVPSNDIAIADSNIRFSGKTLYSTRTLYSGETTLYSGETTLYSGETTLYSGETTLGLLNPLFMGYSKAPSLVWKPPKGLIEDHVKDLRLRHELIGQISAALKPDDYDYGSRALISTKKEDFEDLLKDKPKIEQLQDFLTKLKSLLHRQKVIRQIRDALNPNDYDYGSRDLISTKKQEFEGLLEDKPKIGELDDFLTSLSSLLRRKEVIRQIRDALNPNDYDYGSRDLISTKKQKFEGLLEDKPKIGELDAFLTDLKSQLDRQKLLGQIQVELTPTHYDPPRVKAVKQAQQKVFEALPKGEGKPPTEELKSFLTTVKSLLAAARIVVPDPKVKQGESDLTKLLGIED